MLTFKRFQSRPLRKAARYEPVRSKTRRKPSHQRHAKKRRHEDQTDAGARFPRREILAHDDGVARNDAALEQAEQGRDDVKRCEAVEEEIEQQRDPLQDRAEQKRSQPADAVRHEAGGDPADDAETRA